MHLPTIVILSVVVGFLTCSDANLRTDPVPETPSQVVRQYVSFARAGEFDKAASLTISSLEGKPESAKTNANAVSEDGKQSNSERPKGFTVVPDEKVFAEATLDWVTDFAKSIHDEKLSIQSVKSELAKGSEARVEIILGNETKVELLGWAFLLRKVDDKWKIYNITTRGAPVENL